MFWDCKTTIQSRILSLFRLYLCSCASLISGVFKHWFTSFDGILSNKHLDARYSRLDIYWISRVLITISVHCIPGGGKRMKVLLRPWVSLILRLGRSNDCCYNSLFRKNTSCLYRQTPSCRPSQPWSSWCVDWLCRCASRRQLDWRYENC